MRPVVDPKDSVYVARQPILDQKGGVFGYELLYRAGARATACTADGDLAAASVLNDALLTMGLPLLASDRLAWVNLTRNILLGDLGTLLPPASTVLELREDITVDDEVVATCRTLKGQGYAMALDDYVPGSDAERLLPFVKYVKVDVLATSPAARAALVRQVPKGVQLVAEKVETAEIFAQTKAEGYAFFQGYHFCRPTTFGSGAVSGRKLAYMQLLNALNKENLGVNELEDLIKHDASLSYRVLRCINSAAFGLRQEVRSIRHALVLMGLDQIRKWASVWAFAGLNGGASPEVVTMSILRARTCELLGQRLEGQDGSECFLLGLTSLLDVMLNRPMTQVLDELPLSADIRAALLGESNGARTLLDAVVAYEQGSWDQAQASAERSALDPTLLPWAYSDALSWAREVSHASALAA